MAHSEAQIGLSPGILSQGLIVWNPIATTQFAIPGAMNAVLQYDIFGNITPVHGTTVTVGDAPILLRSLNQRSR